MDAVMGMYGKASVGTIDMISAITNHLFEKALRPILHTLRFSDLQFQTTKSSNIVAWINAVVLASLSVKRASLLHLLARWANPMDEMGICNSLG
jgi:hypothetical protein